MTLVSERANLGIRRRFTAAGSDPFAAVEWESRDARLIDHRDGSVNFEQPAVEVPVSWSQNATNILAQKYFRGTLGEPERESSLRQVVSRVVDTITAWGARDGYFIDAQEADSFRAELIHLLVDQKAAFNSPVWFNIGVEGVPQQASACFILSVDDNMESILNWYAEEGRIFKGGSGAGANLSRVRSSMEGLAGGGTASGPVSFMRGADASAGTIKSGGKTRRAAKMVILDADHPDVEEFVWCKAREERKARALEAAGFDMSLDGVDIHSVQYQNANNSVRVTDEFMQAVLDDSDWSLTARGDGSVIRTVNARGLLRQIAEASWECADPGIQFDGAINHWNTAANTGRINASNPCSEYLHLDDSACNLASLNLLAFFTGDEDQGGNSVDGFDIGGLAHAVRVLFTAQEILVDNADYPTDKIARNTRDFRQLGLGYANLGALLMTLGLPYDSDAGRAVAASVTALITGEAYCQSTRLAARMGPFSGFNENREHMLRVLDQHRAAVADIDENLAPRAILEAARQAWDRTCEFAATSGVRNAQATVLAPTGTIGLLMDCDTTGVEPDLGLVKFKRLVGGGTMSFVNQSVPHALRNLGYSPDAVEAIVAYINTHHSAVGAPGLDPNDLAVFACSLGSDPIHYSGHLKMMGAVQPFISGAISKTVNLPETASVAEIELLLIESWQMGLKAVALYRDNCKVAQPLSTGVARSTIGNSPRTTAPDASATLTLDGWNDAGQELGATDPSTAKRPTSAVEKPADQPVRERLPRTRTSRTFEFRVADCKGFVTVGEYADGRPGEIFVRVSKQGSTLAGIMDAFAISLSHGLQYGVPLSAFVHAFVGMRFEPAGMTDDPEIRIANSLMDYLFRRLAVMYLSEDERASLGIFTTDERTQPTLPGVEEQVTKSVQGSDIPPHRAASAPAGQLALVVDGGSGAPFCMSCGVPMRRAGACYVCGDCGTTSGCS
ncbi:MAG: vitamin B12-dependent ribonucleotide reductase [Acidimicrobiaceae bacterium]|nr:vitamin B12-dependent ribonucleotide reductase [Acidimicrobiaceae bacterium]